MKDDVIIRNFYDEVQEEDLQRFNIERGSAEAQQVLECLAALVALRIWLPVWSQHRISLTVRADNMTVLAMVSRMKASTNSLRIIACEMAMLLTQSCYMPWVAEHTPGVQHGVADALSRKFDPHYRYSHPAVLDTATQCHVPRRSDSWYLTLKAPAQ